ncbi:MAG TPA: ATP-binding protein [Caldimonas sp.]|nr:ATP-binding protein [Caldimonas sp.]
MRNYAIGIGAGLIALALRAALEPWLHGHLPFLLAFGGVTLAVWLAGAGPAIVAAAIGYLGSNAVVAGQPIPSGLFGHGYGIALLAYVLSSGAIIAFGVVIRGAHARLLEEIAVRRRAEDEAVRSQQALALEDRRKSEFLATLAHELRNPLAPIGSAVHVLQGTLGDRPAQAETVAMIDRQVRHMVRLVDDLLDVSRIGRGHLQLKRAPVDLETVLRAAIETTAPLIAANRHRLMTSLATEPLWVDGDGTRLTQVLANLLDNAAKYTPPGGRITVALRAAGDRAEAVVEDDGVGIAPEMLPRVFEMFARIESAASPSQPGLGIGLALSRRLVELHGGSLEAASAGPGSGSRFILRLPRIDAPAPAVGIGLPLRASRAPPASTEVSDAGSSQMPSRRVLVVDDNVDAAMALAAMLELDGHHVRTAFDGVSALELAERFGPEVALLDIGMPGMDGCELARRLAARPWAGRLVLVAITGWGQDGDRRRSAEAGFAHHLVKPVDPPELAALLSTVSPSPSPP